MIYKAPTSIKNQGALPRNQPDGDGDNWHNGSAYRTCMLVKSEKLLCVDI